jgi:hypothetical protein
MKRNCVLESSRYQILAKLFIYHTSDGVKLDRQQNSVVLKSEMHVTLWCRHVIHAYSKADAPFQIVF